LLATQHNLAESANFTNGCASASDGLSALSCFRNVQLGARFERENAIWKTAHCRKHGRQHATNRLERFQAVRCVV